MLTINNTSKHNNDLFYDKILNSLNLLTIETIKGKLILSFIIYFNNY